MLKVDPSPKIHRRRSGPRERRPPRRQARQPRARSLQPHKEHDGDDQHQNNGSVDQILYDPFTGRRLPPAPVPKSAMAVSNRSSLNSSINNISSRQNSHNLLFHPSSNPKINEEINNKANPSHTNNKGQPPKPSSSIVVKQRSGTGTRTETAAAVAHCQSPSSGGPLNMFHLWLVVALNYIALCFRRLLLQRAEMNRKSASIQGAAGAGGEMIEEELDESGYGSAEDHQQQLKQLGKTLQKHLVQQHYQQVTTLKSPKLGGEILTVRNDHQLNSKVDSTSPAFHVHDNKKSKSRQPQVQRPVISSRSGRKGIDVLSGSQDYVLDNSLQRIFSTVSETKIITTVFEVRLGGLADLMEDIQLELNLWFQEEGLLSVCSEVTWSVPLAYRHAGDEIRLKDRLFRALRHNNRAVLDTKWPRQRSSYLSSLTGGKQRSPPSASTSAPIVLPESTTEEVSGKNPGLGAYQGTYRRFYAPLMPYQHKDATMEHSEYWEFNHGSLKPRPEQFLLGNRRDVSELRDNCLVALNIVALKLGRNDQKKSR